MWQPDLRSGDQSFGQLVASQKATGPYSVICLLDPPRNALPAESYRAAQRNIIKLYDSVPRWSPFVVGLQEDFWSAYEERASKRSGTDENGFGIAEALTRSDAPPTVVRLENEEFLRTYKGLEAEAISFMSDAAPFLQQLTNSYHAAVQRLFSTALVDFISKVNQFRVEKDGSVRTYIQEIVRAAESADHKKRRRCGIRAGCWPGTLPCKGP